MNAAFMRLERHERGIHALRTGDGYVPRVTEAYWQRSSTNELGKGRRPEAADIG
jgi:hypothetical protein